MNNNIILVKKMKENSYFKELGVSKIITLIAYLNKVEVDMLVLIENKELFKYIFNIFNNSELTLEQKINLHDIMKRVDLNTAKIISYITCNTGLRENEDVINIANLFVKFNENESVTHVKK